MDPEVRDCGPQSEESVEEDSLSSVGAEGHCTHLETLGIGFNRKFDHSAGKLWVFWTILERIKGGYRGDEYRTLDWETVQFTILEIRIRAEFGLELRIRRGTRSTREGNDGEQ